MKRETTGGRFVTCRRCGRQAFQRAIDGKLLAHTTEAFGGTPTDQYGFYLGPYRASEVCEP